ncbi:hypothetical protein V7S43_015153 [Phytophthora oleae]|uniref:BZIP domain-containing protein n=1 Tax=Phytophthora oleae TaxID=2107226 RepID=A0ABD3F089_9STRA
MFVNRKVSVILQLSWIKNRATFLDEVPEFLGENSGDELLLDSHDLLAETEELLASNEAPTENGDASNTAKSSEEDKQKAVPKGKLSAEKRREIRNAQAAKRRLRYRQHMKEERETLKLQTSELSSQLQELEAAREERKAGKGRGLMFAAWRALAVRQLERRVQAEQQQKLLRAEVVGKARLIHVQVYEMLQSRQIAFSGLIEKTNDVGGTGLLGTMLSELDEHYARTDEVFQDLEFKTAVPATYKLTRKWQEGVLYLDSADRIEFPHDFEHTANTVSKVMMSDQEDDVERS